MTKSHELAEVALDTGVALIDLEADEDEFRSMFRGYLLRAFHATRLLGHEEQMILNQGLRRLSEGLIEDRIDAAFQHGEITAEERERLQGAHVFVEGDRDHRGGKVSLFMSQASFRNRPHGLFPLLSEWGGEAITMSKGGSSLRPRLKQLGKPAVVDVKVDLSGSDQIHHLYPGLLQLFVGAILERENLGASVHYVADVPPEHVIAIWQPGDPEYDRFEQLPQQ